MRISRPFTGRAAAAVPLLAPLLLLAAACAPEESVEVAGPELLDMGADQVMFGMRHRMTHLGVLQARLRADTAFFFNDQSVVRLRGVDAVFFDRQGRRSSRLTARRGEYDMRTGSMEARGDVVVEDSTGARRLETEHLRYRATGNELRSDSSFVWHREGEVIRGEGFVTDPSLAEIEVERPSGTSVPDTAAADTASRR